MEAANAAWRLAACHRWRLHSQLMAPRKPARRKRRHEHQRRAGKVVDGRDTRTGFDSGVRREDLAQVGRVLTAS